MSTKQCFFLYILPTPARRRRNLLEQVGRVVVFGRRNKVLLDRARRDEAVKDRDRARLVVGAGRASTAKGLLANNRARALVVDVKVAGSVAQQVRRALERDAVLAENGTRQGVLGGVFNQRASLFKLVVLVHVDSHDGAENLLSHGD